MDPLELRTPDLAAVLQVGPHESRAHLPHPPGHSSSDEAQHTVDPPGCKDLSVCQMEWVAVMHFEVQEKGNALVFISKFLQQFAPIHFIFWAEEFKTCNYIPYELLKTLRVQFLAIFFPTAMSEF